MHGTNQYVINSSDNRTDKSLRNAIDKIQSLLFDPEAEKRVYTVLLDQLTVLTESDFGVVFSANQLDDDDVDVDVDVDVCLESGECFVNISAVKQLITKKLVPSQPIFFNTPFADVNKALLIDSDKVSSLLILPIANRQGELMSLAVLGKKFGHYDVPLTNRVRPLIGAVVCCLRSAEKFDKVLDVGNIQQKLTGNQFLNSLLATSPIGVLVVDDNGEIIVSNYAAQAIFTADNTRDADEIKNACVLNGQNVHEFIPSFEGFFQWSRQNAERGDINKPYLWENETILTKDKTERLVNISLFRHSYGGHHYTVLQLQDVSSFIERKGQLELLSQQFNALSYLVPVGILQIDTSFHCQFANNKWFEMSGLTEQESDLGGWISAFHEQEVEHVLTTLHKALKSGQETSLDIRLISPFGGVRWVNMHIKVLYDQANMVAGLFATLTDITERLLHDEKLRHLAEYDALTGLANRNRFKVRMEHAIKKLDDDRFTDLAVFFLDLDGFKEINDSLGHEAGDTLLRQVAARLLNAVRDKDTVARLGGDEFIVLLSPSYADTDYPQMASRIISQIDKPFRIQGAEVSVTVSIGISVANQQSANVDSLLNQADAALYLAKDRGKNNFQFFNAELDKQAKARVDLNRQLNKGLENNSFYLTFQPQADINTHKVIGFEVLLRFTDEYHKVVGPDKFIPLLEESGKIIEVGKWVFEKACLQLKDWMSKGVFPEKGSLSINVSPRQLIDDGFYVMSTEICQKHGIDPALIVIEITESVLVESSKTTKTNIDRLKKAGFKLALDDFGTGYSSLSYLQHYSFDSIKIDKSFIINLTENPDDLKITKSIIALARSLNLKVTAEGVEDMTILNALKQLGAHDFQGYLLSKPVDAEKAISFTELSMV